MVRPLAYITSNWSDDEFETRSMSKITKELQILRRPLKSTSISSESLVHKKSISRPKKNVLKLPKKSVCVKSGMKPTFAVRPMDGRMPTTRSTKPLKKRLWMPRKRQSAPKTGRKVFTICPIRKEHPHERTEEIYP